MKKILYLGLEVPSHLAGADLVHYPVIRITPLPRESPEIQKAFYEFASFTHLLFTSKTAVKIFFEYAASFGISASQICAKVIVAVGNKTAAKIQQYGAEATLIAEQETAEGIAALLDRQDLGAAYLFWPHSALARPVLDEWLRHHQIKHLSCIFYRTAAHTPYAPPDLADFSNIIFTSPSTVDAFLCTYKAFPEGKTLTCIGPVTQKYLDEISSRLLFL